MARGPPGPPVGSVFMLFRDRTDFAAERPASFAHCPAGVLVWGVRDVSELFVILDINCHNSDINCHNSDKLALPFLFAWACLSLSFVTFFFEFQMLLLYLRTPPEIRAHGRRVRPGR